FDDGGVRGHPLPSDPLRGPVETGDGLLAMTGRVRVEVESLVLELRRRQEVARNRGLLHLEQVERRGRATGDGGREGQAALAERGAIERHEQRLEHRTPLSWIERDHGDATDPWCEDVPR